jgi:predicted DCC family thiol-disulfide oxidoreductase YuxK
MSQGTEAASNSQDALRVLYDGECGVCSSLATRVRRRDHRRHLQILPYQTQVSADLPPGVSKKDLECALHVVLVDGRVVRGADAVFAVLGALPAPWSWLARLGSIRVTRKAANLLYPVFARHRGTWSRLLRVPPPPD